MIVGVHPLAGFDKVLHYRVPESWRESAALGSLVRVPVRSALRLGIIGSFGPAPVGLAEDKLKAVIQVVHPFPALTPDLLELARWIATYYAAPMDTVIETMIPAAVRRGARLKQRVLIAAGRGLSPEEAAALGRRAPKQAAIHRFLAEQIRPQPKEQVLKRLGASPQSLRALVGQGLAREMVEFVDRDAYRDDWGRGEIVQAVPPELNPEQEAAVRAMEQNLAREKFGVTLLHGVTGSGKTEVYLRAMETALRRDGGVIFLVPEVALTPQTVGRLRGRLEAVSPGHRCIVWHSQLSEGERLDGWLALATGEARVVVGARSAVFAPVRNLALIVVDEEHEPAYKQDETPRYHGRDVAVMRAKCAGAYCLLGSATPSLESFANVEAGKYALLQLPQRVDDRKLPHFDIVDMRIEVARQRGLTAVSRRLADALHERLSRSEQSILFINRRGYATSLQCGQCGHVETCPHCSIAMTYHRSDERLRCHLCGEEKPAPLHCPSCGQPGIRWRGLGTQRVEEAVRRLLPRARIARVDADAMARKNRLREILGEFRLGRLDVLVGTQMIAKGLDFPNVTLVGLIDADLSMHIPDFRANERTFQLLVQVAGRAGRGDRAGEVVVQTFTPQASPIQFSRHADYAGFAAAELGVRREFGYPPYRHLIHHLFRGPSPEKLRFFSGQWAKRVGEALAGRVEIRGPAPAPIEKIKDQYRWQMWYFCASASRVVPDLARLRGEFQWPEDVMQSLDVDPVNLV